MSEESIRFWDFQPIYTGGFSCNCRSTKFGRDDRLEFALSPNPGDIDSDAIATALSTLCGSSYGRIDIELHVSEPCAKAIEGYTHAAVSFAGISEKLNCPRGGGGNFALNFSGGFDSLAAYSLMPKERTKLVSIDWGGNFFREEQFFRRFNPYTVKSNVQRLGYCRETWTFMGIGMILFARSLGIGYGIFGGNFEATLGQMLRCPRISNVYQTAPFSFLGIKDMRVMHGLTEIGSIMTVMGHTPSYFIESLKSVAAPGSEKLYRKSVLSYIVNKKFGYGLDVPIQNEPLKAVYKFGDNVAIDMLCLYEMKHVGREIAAKTVSNIPEDVEDLVCGLDLSFFERLNTNFIESIPSEYQDYYFSQLLKAGIRPYDEEDWYEVDEVCKYLSRWHQEFLTRSDNSRIGHPRTPQLIEIPCNFTLEARAIPSNWLPVTPTLGKSGKYKISVGMVKVIAGESSHVCLSLYDRTGRTVKASRTFAIGESREAKDLKWEFETPDEDGDWVIIAYAGVPGQCDGVSVSYFDVRIS